MNASEYSARLLPSADAIGADVWDACANPEGRTDPHPFTRHAFFAALERSGSAAAETGWRPVHLVLEREGKPRAILPLYLKGHSYGEYVFDQGWAEAFARAGGRYYPKLQASVPFTPVTGRRLLVARGEPLEETSQMLIGAAARAIEELDASSLHITFLSEDEAALAGRMGLLLRHDRQFHWHNRGYGSFDEFLADLSSAKRKTIRRERKAVMDEDVTFEWLTGGDISERHWDAFHDCYIETGRHKWGVPYLTREFFSRAGAEMAEQILLVMARACGRYVAGALNFFGEGVLYGRNWGATGYIPFLHFEACYYQAIDFAIAHGLARVEAGAQGPHKLLRGYLPVATRSAHLIAHPGLRRAVADYLAGEREAVARETDELAAFAPFRKGG